MTKRSLDLCTHIRIVRPSSSWNLKCIFIDQILQEEPPAAKQTLLPLYFYFIVWILFLSLVFSSMNVANIFPFICCFGEWEFEGYSVEGIWDRQNQSEKLPQLSIFKTVEMHNQKPLKILNENNFFRKKCILGLLTFCSWSNIYTRISFILHPFN